MGSTQQRFWSKVNKTDSCWLWTAQIDKDGYGRFNNGRTVRAHQYSYEEAKGSVPAGLELDHLCRIKHCVRLSHLEAVTHLENVQRGLAGHIKRSRTHCLHGHLFDEANTSSRKDGGRICHTCQRNQKRNQRRHERMLYAY